MATLTSVFLGVLAIAAFNAELRLTDASPVPELSVKLLCELLCEHCNGVPNMESGHCNCQVPEAHFKDNAACLERVQISAAEMNLKLTHTAFKNDRRKRSSNESNIRTLAYLGRAKRSPGRSTDERRLSEPVLLHTRDHNTNNSQEQGRDKRSASRGANYDTHEHPITAKPEPENMYRDTELVPQRKNKIDQQYSNITMLELANSILFSRDFMQNGTFISQQGLHAAKRSVIDVPTSFGETVHSKTAINAMPSSSHLSDSESRSSKLSVLDTRRNRRSTTKESDFDIDKDKAKSRREVSVSNNNGDVDFQFEADITIPMFPFGRGSKENSPNPKLQDEADSQLKNKPTSEAEEPAAFVSNKLRDAGEENNPGVISKSSSLLPEIKPWVLIPSTLSPPTITSQAILRTPNDKTALQKAKLNDLKLKLPTLFSIDQPRSPFHSLLPTNKLLKEPRQLIELKDNTPLAKIGLLNPLSKPSLPLSRSQNNALNDLITKSYVNRLTPAQPEGMTVLERIRNYQTKLKQRLAESRSADNLVKPLPLTGCLFKHADSGLTPKLNLPSLIPARSFKSDDGTNLKAPATDFLENFRSKLGNTDGLPQALPNESTLRTEKVNINGVNRNEETVQLSQLTENTNKNGNIPNISSSPLDLTAFRNILNTTPEPTANHPPHSDADQHPEKFQTHQQESTPMGHSAPSESTMGPILKDVEDKSHPTQTVGPSLMSKDTIPTLSDHPHFLNHNDDRLSPHHFPSLLVQPTLANTMQLSPEDRYRAMFDPTAFQNSMQQINYPALLARNDLPGAAVRDSYQNVPLVLVPNSAVPFDHPSNLMTPFNGGYTPPHLPHSEPSGIIMRTFVPGDHPREHYPNNPAIPSSVFVMSPLPIQGGNIPYPDLLNQLRTGNAIVQIHPVNIDGIDK